METLRRTVFFERHLELGAQMVPFGGWEMPLQYADGIVAEHLATRKHAGLFDVCHMGRMKISGPQALAFLQHVLTNNAAALDVGTSQYTMIPNANGGAVDDAYLYRFFEDEYLLVVNAANRQKDWQHLQTVAESFPGAQIAEASDRLAMVSLQGPAGKDILQGIIRSGRLPEPVRNALRVVDIDGSPVCVARTGYTGEPICFELFADTAVALQIWQMLLDRGARPVGLGARDTLRLEAGLPLYGHELGCDADGREIPIFACPLARFAVSLSPLKKDFIGKAALQRQFDALKNIQRHLHAPGDDLPRRILPFAVLGRGIARAGDAVFQRDRKVGVVTSGTMVPYWKSAGEGIAACLTEEKAMRAIGLALLDSRLTELESIDIGIRGKAVASMIVPYHLRSEAPPYAKAIIWSPESRKAGTALEETKPPDKVAWLLAGAVRNTQWRQQECVNLIPSEQTASPAARLLSILDPAGRYAEHRPIKAFADAEVFYYQGTDFIAQVERRLQEELQTYLGCSAVEARTLSGQMANVAVFSGLTDYVNRTDRKREPRRLRSVLNHHILKGGHLSAQPMGALKDFVARDPVSEKPAVVNFPVLPDNPYKVDTAACRTIIERHRPELVVFGRSMALTKEPVAALRAMVDDLGLDTLLMYDMAHVLGLAGPYFQMPFAEGAHIVTASTHKTFFGTQRGIIACTWEPGHVRYPLWEAIQRRTFPGSVSNHHLGTLLGLLMAAYEMNAFKDEYQQQVLANAKAFARALHEVGFQVAGDPADGFTETHQVIVTVGYAKGPEIARRLEENNIIVNYQAAPEEEGFTASGALRMGMAEMTRFGMAPEDAGELAQLMHDLIINGRPVKDAVIDFRQRFLEMRYCFSDERYQSLIQRLHRMI